MDLPELIAHESGVWVVATFLEEKMVEYLGHPLTSDSEGDDYKLLPYMINELNEFLFRIPANEYTVASMRQLTLQLYRFARESGLPGCDMNALVEWLWEFADTELQVGFVLACIEEVLDIYAWNPNPDIKDLTALQKALPVNWNILRSLREQATSGMMGPTDELDAFERSVASLLARARKVLNAFYGA